MNNIRARNEFCLLVGDLNKLVGCDKLGVPGNHPEISPGGKLLRTQIDSKRKIDLARAVKTNGVYKFVYLDHFPSILTFTLSVWEGGGKKEVKNSPKLANLILLPIKSFAE